MSAQTKPITVAELKSFEKDAEKVWNEDERNTFIDFFARHPDKGLIIEGTGGVRKIRWSREGMGKRGGVRVVYYFYSEEEPIYLLAIYGKGERSDLDAAQKKAARTFVDNLKLCLKRKRQ